MLCAFLTHGVLVAAPVRAETLDALLEDILKTHDRIIAAEASVESAKNKAREALGQWFPTLDQTGKYGFERQQKASAANTSVSFQEYDLKLTQLLWDFGSTNALIEKARLRLDESQTLLIQTRQDLILEAANAYVNYVRSHKVLEFARQSEKNILRQTGLEEARITTGTGLSTDVLQAKTQLLGAETRRIQAQGALIAANNRHLNVFYVPPKGIDTFVPVTVRISTLPVSLDEALDQALKHNTELIIARLSIAQALADLDRARSSTFFPKFSGILENNFKNNVGGTLNFERESIARFEFTFPFNLGFTAVNTLRASKNDHLSTVRTVTDTRRRIEEEVRNAWMQLDIARSTKTALDNQADLAGAFLELARQERQMGMRSLIDVLSGETALINAQSDAASAEADVVIAMLGLLDVTGRLTLDVIQEAPQQSYLEDTPEDPASNEFPGMNFEMNASENTPNNPAASKPLIIMIIPLSKRAPMEPVSREPIPPAPDSPAESQP